MSEEKYKELQINGTTYKTKLGKKFEKSSKWEKDNDKKILAVIPGTIKEIYVKTGTTVKKGDVLMILEAMKMRNRIKAHKDGKIKTILVEENQIVAKNYVLLEFE